MKLFLLTAGLVLLTSSFCARLTAQQAAPVPIPLTGHPNVPSTGARKTFLLRYHFTVGDVATYKASEDESRLETMSGGNPPHPMTPLSPNQTTQADGIDTWKVLNVRLLDGSAQIQNSLVLNRCVSDGKENTSTAKMTVAAERPPIAAITATGVIVNADTASTDVDTGDMPSLINDPVDFTMSQFPLPAASVHVGDSWTGTFGGSDSGIVTHSTIAAVTPGPDGTVVQIVSQGSGLLSANRGPFRVNNGRMRFNAEMLFNVDHGQMESYRSKLVLAAAETLPLPTGRAELSLRWVMKVQLTRLADAK